MSQTFKYPNLIAGTGNIATVHLHVSDGSVSETVGTDEVVGRYNHIVLLSDVQNWAFIAAKLSDAFGDIHEGARLSFSAFLRVNDGPESRSIYIRRNNGTKDITDAYNRSYLDVRGGGAITPVRAYATPQNSPIRFSTYMLVHRRPVLQSTLPNRWSASPTSRMHGHQQKGRC